MNWGAWDGEGKKKARRLAGGEVPVQPFGPSRFFSPLERPWNVVACFCHTALPAYERTGNKAVSPEEGDSGFSMRKGSCQGFFHFLLDHLFQ